MDYFVGGEMAFGEEEGWKKGEAISINRKTHTERENVEVRTTTKK